MQSAPPDEIFLMTDQLSWDLFLATGFRAYTYRIFWLNKPLLTSLWQGEEKIFSPCKRGFVLYMRKPCTGLSLRYRSWGICDSFWWSRKHRWFKKCFHKGTKSRLVRARFYTKRATIPNFRQTAKLFCLGFTIIRLIIPGILRWSPNK